MRNDHIVFDESSTSATTKAYAHLLIGKSCVRLNRHCEYQTSQGRPGKSGPSTSSNKDISKTPIPPDAVGQIQGGRGRSCAIALHVALSGETVRHEYTAITSLEPERLDNSTESFLVSRDIHLTTTMDLLRTQDNALHPISEYFLESVECPGITCIDAMNWHSFKTHVAEEARHHSAIAAAMIAVSLLCRGINFNLPQEKSLDAYNRAKMSLDICIGQPSKVFTVIIITSFLICQFELLHTGELAPYHMAPSAEYLRRLKQWTHDTASQSSLTSRLCTWLIIIHWKTRRGGRQGLISDAVQDLLPGHPDASPGILPALEGADDLTSHTIKLLGAPIFDFYVRLQLLSAEISKLTHYHRPRTKSIDQEEVCARVNDIKARLRLLFDNRCALQKYSVEEIQRELPGEVAIAIARQVALCHAAYYAEFIEMDRVVGDPVLKWTDAPSAIDAIQAIVESQLDHSETYLDPGFLRPLFLCAIESTNAQQNEWAVSSMYYIPGEIHRAKFFAAFGQALFTMQMQKDRRVTSKYFCLWRYGILPPFL